MEPWLRRQVGCGAPVTKPAVRAEHAQSPPPIASQRRDTIGENRDLREIVY
jgi:hypothetical protein